jgi:hypothetical protein
MVTSDMRSQETGTIATERAQLQSSYLAGSAELRWSYPKVGRENLCWSPLREYDSYSHLSPAPSIPGGHTLKLVLGTSVDRRRESTFKDSMIQRRRCLTMVIPERHPAKDGRPPLRECSFECQASPVKSISSGGTRHDILERELFTTERAQLGIPSLAGRVDLRRSYPRARRGNFR